MQWPCYVLPPQKTEGPFKIQISGRAFKFYSTLALNKSEHYFFFMVLKKADKDWTKNEKIKSFNNLSTQKVSLIKVII